jgi:hypothetical protein
VAAALEGTQIRASTADETLPRDRPHTLVLSPQANTAPEPVTEALQIQTRAKAASAIV